MRENIIKKIEETNNLINLGKSLNERFAYTGFEPINVNKLIKERDSLQSLLDQLNNTINTVKE